MIPDADCLSFDKESIYSDLGFDKESIYSDLGFDKESYGAYLSSTLPSTIESCPFL